MSKPEDLARIVSLQTEREQLKKSLSDMVRIANRCSNKERYSMWQEVLQNTASDAEKLLSLLK